MPRRSPTHSALLAVALLWLAALPASAASSPELTEARKKKLDESWHLSHVKKKGPFTANMCVCTDGTKEVVRKVDGKLVTPCAGKIDWCESFRSDAGKALAEEGVYIGNLFKRDLYEWDEIGDHHDLVRGYILEKYFIETHPEDKLAQLRAYGGLAGSEFEAEAMPVFFERYLDMESFDEPRHYLLAYELQRRFFLRNDQGQIHRVRSQATAIQGKRRDFKPLRDQTHNQISAALIPRLTAYRDALPPGEAVRGDLDSLIAEIQKLTSLDESALASQLPGVESDGLRAELEGRLPASDAEAVEKIRALSELMVFCRKTVEAKEVPAADRRRLVDLAITAGAVIQALGSNLLASGVGFSARAHLELLLALTDASYGAGLLMERERLAARQNLEEALAESKPRPEDLSRRLDRAGRVVEWAQLGTLYAFEEVRPQWNHVAPATQLFPDDVLRGSPLLLYAEVHQRLEDFATGEDPIRHHLFGSEAQRDVRALNPGLAYGTLRVDPAPGTYSRVEVIALAETPAELDPAAGILTQGEGNVVSHVQLLARALGIPNVVLGPAAYQTFEAHDGKEVFFIATPGGRVVVKEASGLTDADRDILNEYRKGERPTDDGGLGGGGGAAKLHIDKERLVLDVDTALSLDGVRRKDSGTSCGPKAAFLGELKHLFPDHVARGVVVPFGAYYAHYQNAVVSVPKELAKQKVATSGEPLKDFVERTYAVFFDDLVASGKDDKELAAWIRPRLEVVRHSIREAPMSEELAGSIERELAAQGLLLGASDTVGLFVRSDTNVEDLDNFNGAGLNLTLFNLRSLADIYEGIKQVWASPFTYRSFAWRQTLIDEPLWVLPSIVILESVPSEKSGVLVTADIDTGDPGRMVIATSEGVGGAVDGSPAETLVWSEDGVELVTMFKSPWRRMLGKDGGSEVVPSTRGEFVLSDEEVVSLVEAGAKIRDALEPSRDATGRPRPWDIEFGFANGQLWLFQSRPFIGNEELKNVPALASYEVPANAGRRKLSLDQAIP